LRIISPVDDRAPLRMPSVPVHIAARPIIALRKKLDTEFRILYSCPILALGDPRMKTRSMTDP
jgi:hypothetical protein